MPLDTRELFKVLNFQGECNSALCKEVVYQLGTRETAVISFDRAIQPLYAHIVLLHSFRHSKALLILLQVHTLKNKHWAITVMLIHLCQIFSGL